MYVRAVLQYDEYLSTYITLETHHGGAVVTHGIVEGFEPGHLYSHIASVGTYILSVCL